MRFFKYQNEDIEILKEVLKLRGNVNQPSHGSEFPLLLMASYASQELFEFFLSLKKVDLEVKNSKGETCLLMLSKMRDKRKLQALLEKGCEVNQVDHRGRNALHWAVNNNVGIDSDFSVEEMLIERGIDMNCRDRLGRTPIFHFFVKVGHELKEFDPIENFQNFILYGKAELNLQDHQGCTILHYAAQKDSFLCINQTIKNKDFNPNLLDGDGNSILSTCLIHKRFNTCLMLLQHPMEVSHELVFVDYHSRTQFLRREKKKSRIEIEEEFVIRYSEWESKLSKVLKSVVPKNYRS